MKEIAAGLIAAGAIGTTWVSIDSQDIKPPFKNSVASTDFDYIKADDPDAFESIRFVGRERTEMPDKRNDELMSDNTFVFEAKFRDGKLIPIWAHNSFGDVQTAQRYATMVTGPLGKLPEPMRKILTRVVIHKGNETAFAEDGGHFFVLYSENMETRVKNHDLEETVFHESVHATLDQKHAKTEAWLSAQKADGAFITEYGANNAGKEDMAESALFAYTMLKYPGRLPAEVEDWVRKNTPNRLAFFKKIFAEMEKKPGNPER